MGDVGSWYGRVVDAAGRMLRVADVGRVVKVQLDVRCR